MTWSPADAFDTGQPIDDAQELERAERLVEQRVRADARRVLLADLGPRQKHDEGRLGSVLPLQLRTEGKSVDSWHRHVEQDDRRAPEPGQVEGAASVLGLCDLELRRQRRMEQRAQRSVVVDDEDSTRPEELRAMHRRRERSDRRDARERCCAGGRFRVRARLGGRRDSEETSHEQAPGDCHERPSERRDEEPRQPARHLGPPSRCGFTMILTGSNCRSASL
jgi:hypothetical protein